MAPTATDRRAKGGTNEPYNVRTFQRAKVPTPPEPQGLPSDLCLLPSLVVLMKAPLPDLQSDGKFGLDPGSELYILLRAPRTTRGTKREGQATCLTSSIGKPLLPLPIRNPLVPPPALSTVEGHPHDPRPLPVSRHLPFNPQSEIRNPLVAPAPIRPPSSALCT